MKNLKVYLHRTALLITAASLLFAPAVAYANNPTDQVYESPDRTPTQEQLDSEHRDTAWYDPNFGFCEPLQSTSVEEVGDHQAAMTRAIIGVAKTLGVGERGALIGLMTALVESSLQNYANSTIPESEQNPDWLAIPEPRPLGSDYDSVGIMQQRVGRDEGRVGIAPWSTYGIYEFADTETRRQIVWQIMDPLYAAQAFYGTPPDAELPNNLSNPDALRQGLLNLEQDWQSLDPGEAAQAVQGSNFPDRYAERQSQAQSLLNQYWANTSPLPLAIPLTGLDAPQFTDDCDFVAGSEFERVIQEYAWAPRPEPAAYRWPDSSRWPDAADPCAQIPALGCLATESYRDATQKAMGNTEYVGGCSDCGCNYGIDCGGFVTRVMRDSGIDPNYNASNSNVAGGQYPYLLTHTVQVADVQSTDVACPDLSHRPDTQVKYVRLTNVQSTGDLCPGDIWINTSLSHTYLFIGDEIDGFDGYNKAGASISTRRGQCSSWRAPMAGTAYNLGQMWYRAITPSGTNTPQTGDSQAS